MRFFDFLKFYLIFVALFFVILSLFSLGTFLKFIFFILASAISPQAYKIYLGIKGVKKGDGIFISRKTRNNMGGFISKFPGTSLQDGKVGDLISIESMGVIQTGKIINMGGIIFPPEVIISTEERDTNQGVEYIDV